MPSSSLESISKAILFRLKFVIKNVDSHFADLLHVVCTWAKLKPRKTGSHMLYHELRVGARGVDFQQEALRFASKK